MTNESAVVPIGVAALKRNAQWLKPENWRWRQTFAFVTHGVPAAVRVTEPAALVPVKLRLTPGWRPTGAGSSRLLYSLVVGNNAAPTGLERLHLLFRGSALISVAYQLEPVLGALESDLDLQVATRAAPRRVFIRAGVAGWHGRAIVVVGPPQSGTSTLLAELVRTGATYYSDQYAVLDGGRRVHPFPRPLWLSAGYGVNPARYRPQELGAEVGTQPLPLGVVAITRYRPGVRSHLEPLLPDAAATEVAANAVYPEEHQTAVMGVVRKAMTGTWVLRGMRGEAAGIARILMGNGLLQGE
jgi:hypothetical protein